jgi:UDP-2,4-diacetamido-2,4,6-trideoxy-beta-L-altropyranose hydrolase
MKVVFRVDASLCMGIGHFMRCLTLADALRERGAQVRFICREHNGHLVNKLSQKAIPVTVLPAPETTDISGREDYAAWLGVSQAEDAKESIEALNKDMPDWLVVDHYGLAVEWEEQLRPHVKRLMVIDDLANRRHNCDLLLDQNFGRYEQDYKGIVNSDCKFLIGPHYALIRPEYVTYRKTLRERDGQVNRVLVFFGGSDPDNMTGLALQALSNIDFQHIQVDLVIGANYQHCEKLELQRQQRLNTRIYGPQPHLADLMAQADIAIGAGGATTWERMCLGLPTVVVSIAENQKPASEALFEAGLIDYAGHFSDVKQDQLEATLRLLFVSAKKLANVSVYNKLLVDGLGSSRLIELMLPSPSSELCLRPASLDDIILYYNWANDPEVRKNAINMADISWETHSAWFSDKLEAVNSRLFVLEVLGLPIGQIRFDKNGNEAYIDYSLDSIVRGRGWGTKLVKLGSDLIQQNEVIKLFAEVKDRNNASSAVFLRVGFTETQKPLNECIRSFYRNPIGLSDFNQDKVEE